MIYNLHDVAVSIREQLQKYKEENQLTFTEETHSYSILNKNTREIVTDLPSVSKVYKRYKKQFDAMATSLRLSKGDEGLALKLRNQWKDNGQMQAHKGSYVHYHLEEYLRSIYNHKEEVRMPIFDNEDVYRLEANAMVEQGKRWIDLMRTRGAYLVATELEMGSLEIGMFGQLDKLWVMQGKDGSCGLVITDWKTNKPSKFEVDKYTDYMLSPFRELNLFDNAIGEYSVQLSLYARLLLSMVNLPYLGSVIVNVSPDDFKEYRVSKNVFETCNQLIIY